MKLAIMQPYLFPYLGYYQMVAEADIFICYDTVDYKQRGWINRNKILISNKPAYFTVPVSKKPLGTPIYEIQIIGYNKWLVKFLKTIELSYKKAPHYNEVYQLLIEILSKKQYKNISNLAVNSIKGVSQYLDLSTNFVMASDIKAIPQLKTKEEKLNSFIDHFNASSIILPPGSKDLYANWDPIKGSKMTMAVPEIEYKQYKYKSFNNLSIIDVLMHNSVDEVIDMVNAIKFL